MNDITIQNNTESPPGVTSANKQAPQTESTSFGQMLKDSLDQVDRLQHESKKKHTKFGHRKAYQYSPDHDCCREVQRGLRVYDADSQQNHCSV